jgi:SAM-dependent methyltransferase
MYEIEYHESFNNEDSHWWFVTRDRLVFDFIDKCSMRLERQIDLFDVGSGTGGLLFRCKDHQTIANYSGCEPNEVGLSYSKMRGLNVIDGGIEDLYKITQKFDVITCMDVLYHKNVEPNFALASIRNLLRDNGILIINVAAMPQLAGRHDIRDEGGRRFLRKELGQLLVTNGYKIETLKYWNTILAPLIWFIRFMQKTFPLHQIDTAPSEVKLPNMFVNRFLVTLLSFEERLGLRVNFPFGCSLIAVVKKSH